MQRFLRYDSKGMIHKITKLISWTLSKLKLLFQKILLRERKEKPQARRNYLQIAYLNTWEMYLEYIKNTLKTHYKKTKIKSWANFWTL